MPTFLLCHQHRAQECPVAIAAWKGFESQQVSEVPLP
jgi:hypothetical protein